MYRSLFTVELYVFHGGIVCIYRYFLWILCEKVPKLRVCHWSVYASTRAACVWVCLCVCVVLLVCSITVFMYIWLHAHFSYKSMKENVMYNEFYIIYIYQYVLIWFRILRIFSVSIFPFSLSLSSMFYIFIISFNRDVVQFLNKYMISRGADSKYSNKRCGYLHLYPFLLMCVYILFNLIIYYHSIIRTLTVEQTWWSRIQQHFIYIQFATFPRQVFAKTTATLRFFFG